MGNRENKNNYWTSITNWTMGKRRNNAKSQATKAGDNSMNNMLKIYDFDAEQMCIEEEALKSASKFESKKPSNKFSKPMEKYDFLVSFANKCKTPQNGSKNAAIEIDDSDTVLSWENKENKGRENISYKTSSWENKGREDISYKTSSWENKGREDLSYKTSSWENKGREAISHKTEELHNPVYNVDSDEDGRKEIRISSGTALADEKGSLEERPSRNGISATDCEAVVVVSPEYIKYGNKYYTTLTFSSKYITLESSTLRRSRRHSQLEWSTSDIIKIVSQPSESVGVDVVNVHLKTKDTNVVEVCDGNSGTVALEFVVLDDPRWFKNQKEIKSLNMKYEDTWETIVSGERLDKHFDHIIYPEGDPDAISVSSADVELLKPRTFINDTLIDFYIKFLINKTNPEEQHKFHFFNTFFFRKLREIYRDLSSTSEEVKGFECVRKWTRNLDLFEKDYIFIPVNFSLHWSLIVICHPGKVANLRDKNVRSSKKPCILHMDSIKGSHRGLEKLIQSYLWEEWKVRHDAQDADISSKFLNLRFVELQLPQQDNSFDCGLFLLHYAELFLEQVPSYSTTKYPMFCSKDWFLPAEVSLKKREYIRELIYKIAEDNATKNPPCSKDLPSDVNEGESDVKIIQPRDVKEAYNSIELDDSIIDHDDMKPESYLDTIEQEICSTSNMLSPHKKEENATRSRLEADVPSGSFNVGTMIVPYGDNNEISQEIINVDNEEGSVHEEMQECEDEYYSMLSEEEKNEDISRDHQCRYCFAKDSQDEKDQYCIVEDSQDETDEYCIVEDSQDENEDLQLCIVEDSEDAM